MNIDRQHAHQLLDRLDPGQLAAVLQLIEVMLHPDDEPLTEEDRRAVAAARKWFQENPAGIPFEQVVAECGLTMDDIRSYRSD